MAKSLDTQTDVELEALVSKFTASPFSLLKVLQEDTLTKDQQKGLDMFLLELCKKKDAPKFLSIFENILDRFKHLIDINKSYKYNHKSLENPKSDLPFNEFLPFLNSSNIRSPRELGKLSNLAMEPTQIESLETFDDTLLTLATKHDNREIAKSLLCSNASLSCTNCCGRTPIFTARITLFKHFMENHAQPEVNVQDKLGQSPLIVAAIQKKPKKLGSLLDWGADPRLVDNNGFTALHHAFQLGHASIFERLLKSDPASLDCDPHGCIRFADVPLMLAAKLPGPVSKILSLLKEKSNEEGKEKEKVPAGVATASEALYRVWAEYPIPIAELKKQELVSIIERQKGFKVHPPQKWYDGRKEAKSKKELEHMLRRCGSNQDVAMELFYQVVLISERIGGTGNYLTLLQLIKMSSVLLKEGPEHSECFRLMTRATEMLLHRTRVVKFSPDIKTYFQFVIDLLRDIDNLHLLSGDMLFPVIENLAEAILVQMENLRGMHGHTFATDETLDITPVLELITTCTSVLTHLLNMCVLFQRHNQAETRFVGVARSVCGRCPDFNFSGYTPQNVLHMSMYQYGDDGKYVSSLLDLGASRWLNSRGLMGNTPLHIALIKMETSPKTIKCLLKRGAHVDTINCSNFTPLDLAMFPNHISIMKSQFPSSLMCLTANKIVHYGLPYRTIDLPTNIKSFIDLHCAPPHSLSIL